MSFEKCQAIEAESKRILIPFVSERFGSLPRELPTDYDSQRRGDWVIRREDGFELEVELKAEKTYTGNLFLETVSNWHTSRCGWFATSAAFQLWYHFLDLNRLYIIPLGQLRRWFWGNEMDVDDGACQKYRQVSQKKYQQDNLTQGYLVPIADIMADVEGVEMIQLGNT